MSIAVKCPPKHYADHLIRRTYKPVSDVILNVHITVHSIVPMTAAPTLPDMETLAEETVTKTAPELALISQVYWE